MLAEDRHQANVEYIKQLAARREVRLARKNGTQPSREALETMAKATAKKQAKAQEVKTAQTGSKKELVKQARSLNVPYWYAMNSDELAAANKAAAAKDQIVLARIVGPAQARWNEVQARYKKNAAKAAK